MNDVGECGDEKVVIKVVLMNVVMKVTKGGDDGGSY